MSITEILNPKPEKEIWDRLFGLSPEEMLLSSAYYGFLSGVKKALDDGADINFVNDEGCSALAYASGNNNFDIVSYLLQRNASVCNLALIGTFERLDLFKEMLQKSDSKECCYYILALKVAEEKQYKEIESLILERINQAINYT